MVDELVSKDLLVNRLKRIEGQVRGLEKMIESGRECEHIVIQLTAVRSAIESVGALILKNYMNICFPKESRSESTNIDSLARAISVWGGIRVGD